MTKPSLAHHLFRRRQRLNERWAAEDTLGVLHQWRGLLRQRNTIVIHTPQQRGDGHIEHGKFVSEHVLLLNENGRDLSQTVSDHYTRLVRGFLRPLLNRIDVAKQFLLEAEQEQS